MSDETTDILAVGALVVIAYYVFLRKKPAGTVTVHDAGGSGDTGSQDQIDQEGVDTGGWDLWNIPREIF